MEEQILTALKELMDKVSNLSEKTATASENNHQRLKVLERLLTQERLDDQTKFNTSMDSKVNLLAKEVAAITQRLKIHKDELIGKVVELESLVTTLKTLVETQTAVSETKWGTNKKNWDDIRSFLLLCVGAGVGLASQLLYDYITGG